MLHVITPAGMQALERRFMAETGTPGDLLMERAATALAEKAAALTDEGALFLCGPGNNGGDGYAAARLFAAMGRNAWIWALADPTTLRGDAAANYRRAQDAGIPIATPDALPTCPPAGCGLLVDALFGTGLARPLEGLYADAVRWMNAQALPILAVDMPSGTASLMAKASATVTFHQAKTTHFFFPGRTHTGQLSIADIGIPSQYAATEYVVFEANDDALLPLRPSDAHKGNCGHAYLYAGSPGMAGAAALCANAAIRGGSGLVTAICPAEITSVIQILAPCATCITPDAFRAAAPQPSAIATGPGLGSSPAMAETLAHLLTLPCPQVWDADALNWLAQNPRTLDIRFILTPHPGEAARLLGCTTEAITADPLAAADALHTKYQTTVLLKGATTVIVDGAQRALNTTGSPGMATGGSGDVLTGIILALLAQGLTPFHAAQLGAFLHGQAGEKAAKARSIRSMAASDIIDALYID